MTYVDRPEIADTFVDSLRRATFDGVNVRIEFTVNRLDDPQPPSRPTGRALTACRVIIPLTGFLAMTKQLDALVNTLRGQGVLRHMQSPPSDGKPN
ncbi:MAG TPA: hypothetical protein VME41_09305 [Stellaceae bacterium]|nr:hypothetical protein [Stellaceae bacterium]